MKNNFKELCSYDGFDVYVDINGNEFYILIDTSNIAFLEVEIPYIEITEMADIVQCIFERNKIEKIIFEFNTFIITISKEKTTPKDIIDAYEYARLNCIKI